MFTINEFTTAIQKNFFTFTYTYSHSAENTQYLSSNYGTFSSYENETFASRKATASSTSYQIAAGINKWSSSSSTRGDSTSTIYVAGYSFIRFEAAENGVGETSNASNFTYHITDTFWPTNNERIYNSTYNGSATHYESLIVDIGIRNKQTSIIYNSNYNHYVYYLASRDWLEFNGLGGYSVVNSTIASDYFNTYTYLASYVTDGFRSYTSFYQNGTSSSSSAGALAGVGGGIFGIRSTAGYTYSSNGTWSFYGTSNETVFYEGGSAVVTANYLRTSTFNPVILSITTSSQVTTDVLMRTINGTFTQYGTVNFDTLVTTISTLDSSTGESSIITYLNDYFNNSAAGLGLDIIDVISAASSEILYHYKVDDNFTGPVKFNLSDYTITDKVSLIGSYAEFFTRHFISYTGLTAIPTAINFYSSFTSTFNIQFTSTSLKNTSLTFLVYNAFGDQGILFPLTQTDSYRNTAYYTYDLTRTITYYANTLANVTLAYNMTTQTVWDYSLNDLYIYNIDDNDQMSILTYNNFYPKLATVNTYTVVGGGNFNSWLSAHAMGATFRIEKGVASTTNFSSTFLESFPYRAFGYRDFVNNNYQQAPQLLNNKWFPFAARVVKYSTQTMFTPYFGTFTTHYVVNSTNRDTTSLALYASKTISIDGRSIFGTTKHTKTTVATSITELVSYTDSYVYLENNALEPFKVSAQAVEQNNNKSSFYYTGTNKKKLDSIIYNMFGFARFHDLTNGELASTSLFESVAISYSSDLSTKFVDIRQITYLSPSVFNYAGPYGVYYYFSASKTFDVDFLG